MCRSPSNFVLPVIRQNVIIVSFKANPRAVYVTLTRSGLRIASVLFCSGDHREKDSNSKAAKSKQDLVFLLLAHLLTTRTMRTICLAYMSELYILQEIG